MMADGRAAGVELAHFIDAGIDIEGLALQLQREGTESFVKAWQQLLQRISHKSENLLLADPVSARY